MLNQINNIFYKLEGQLKVCAKRLISSEIYGTINLLS